MCGEYLEVTEGEQCVIFSVGSNGDFAFENEMKSFVKDSCKVDMSLLFVFFLLITKHQKKKKIYTFDCTGNWSDPTTTFKPWCISDRTYVDNSTGTPREFKSLNDMMAGVNVTYIDLFKLDVEGHEYKVLDALANAPRHLLPVQFLIELHFGWDGFIGSYPDGTDPKKGQNFAGMALDVGRKFANMGYKLALREMNIFSNCCAEYVWIKV